MRLPLYQVDAFASRVFEGNPAAVVPLEAPIEPQLMQAIARENNLSETAFLVPTAKPGTWDIRWFTPAVEIDLCGHATLASAFVLRHAGLLPEDACEVHFESFSGPLTARFDGDTIELEFPADPPAEIATPSDLEKGLGTKPLATLRGHRDLLAVLDSESTVRELDPDFAALTRVAAPVIASARGDEVDFVSRFFAPTVGVPEDPVTGSAHCVLTPYWSSVLGPKASYHARQLSARGGQLTCRLDGERVRIAGLAVLYFEGSMTLDIG